MKLGVAYNVFDGHELLEKSILSIRACASLVVIVWQKVSNFGEKCNPFLEQFLLDLQSRGLVDVLVEYVPNPIDILTRNKLVSKNAEGLDGPSETIGMQFFHEISKREIGRVKCLEKGCTHFLLMDCDEFYLEDEMRHAMKAIERNGYDTTACRMRMFLKEPTYEYFPYDTFQVVPFICKLSSSVRLALAAPFASLLADPTRRPETLGFFFFFERGGIEMYHYSYVRLDMRKKMSSVSNKGNYTNVSQFLEKFENYNLEEHGAISPHPVISRLFSEVRETKNYFDIDLKALCSNCFFTKQRCVCKK